MLKLKTERLAIEILEPGEQNNNSTRFDHSAYISRVILDGRHRFCTVEPCGTGLPCTNGAGLCSEIKCESTFAEAPEDDFFAKFGVGLLRKPRGARNYLYQKKYDSQFYDWEYDCGEDSAWFRSVPRPWGGYNIRETKKVLLKENTLEILYEFINEGEKKADLTEYCHNFINIDDHPIGESYYLEMSVPPQDGNRAEQDYGTVYGRGRGFTYTGYEARPAMIFPRLEEKPDKDCFFWELTHRDSPASIREETSFSPDKVLVWSIGKNISPEVLHRMVIPPGETSGYSRKWIFRD